MPVIRKFLKIDPNKSNGLNIVYLLGYGGRLWHSKRHIKLLQDAGYTIYAMDFHDVLKNRDPQDLITVMDEVEAKLKECNLISKRTIIVGVSMGGLIGFNMLKRHDELKNLLVITGGNMALIPKSYRQRWPISYEELANIWSEVNIYTKAGVVNGKYITMILPSRDRMIDPEEVTEELEMLSKHNKVLVIRPKAGHFRTIITETILRPRKSFVIIRDMSKIEDTTN